MSLNDNLFHCTICNKNISCNTSISRHANSTNHKSNIKENMSVSLNNKDVTLQKNKDVTLEKNIPKKILNFQHQWLEIEHFQPWLREVSHGKTLCFCSFCEMFLTAKMSCISRYAESATHITVIK